MVKVSPAFKEKLERVISRAAEEGIVVMFHQGYRSLEYQKQLHDWWLDESERKLHGIVVEPALPGLSTHNYGEGGDYHCVPDHSASYLRVGEIAKEEGLRYGGDFTPPDFVHIDNLFAFGGGSFAIDKIDNMRLNFDESKLVEI